MRNVFCTEDILKIIRLTKLPQIVFHGTTTEHQSSLENIKVDCGRKDLDFGQGFYTTSIKNQAIDWAKGKVWNGHKPLVLTYKVDFDMIKSLNGIHFEFAEDDWVNFIYKHRMETFNINNMNYDYVYGHIADGKISLLIEDIKNGNKTFTNFKKEIYPTGCRKFYYDQLFFRSELSIKALEKIDEEVF
jgi:hypothetical protein